MLVLQYIRNTSLSCRTCDVHNDLSVIAARKLPHYLHFLHHYRFSGMCCVALVTGAAPSGLQLCTEATSVFSFAMSRASVWLCYIDLTSACFLVSKPGSAFLRSSLFHGL